MSRPTTSPRRVVAARWGLVYFACSIVALVWPVFGWLGNRIEPRVIGLPWSLVYVLGVVAANTAVLAWLYRGDPGEDDV